VYVTMIDMTGPPCSGNSMKMSFL